MPVYPSRRTCGVPDFVAENTKNNAGFAKMSADGSELTDAHLPGYPFPAPKTGAEVMWNAKLHYRGAGVEMRDIITVVSPRKGASDWIKNVSDAWIYQPWGDKAGTTFAKVKVEGNAYYAYKSPAAIAGGRDLHDLRRQADRSLLLLPGATPHPSCVVCVRCAADRLRQPVQHGRSAGLLRADGPILLEAARQEGNDRYL